MNSKLMSKFNHSPAPLDVTDSDRDAGEKGRPGLGPMAFAVGSPSATASAYLIVGDLIIPLDDAGETVIGRDNSTCEVVLADPHVSKRHALIHCIEGRFYLRDLDSLNGVLVNQETVAGARALTSGDTILIPPYEIEFAGTAHPRILQLAESRADPFGTPIAGQFTGQLNILSVSDLVQLLNATRQSGILTILDQDRQSALLSIHAGEVLQAQYRDIRGAEAVFELLGLTEGQFEFIQGCPPVPSRPIQVSTLTLLLDGCRMLDEDAGLREDTLLDDNDTPRHSRILAPPALTQQICPPA